MQLPSTLLREFASITDDRPDKPKETTLYGTVVQNEGDDQLYVQLDGSDILTPVEMAMDARAGDRVVVMIKNHQAIITGNTSNPASAYTASTYIKTIDETLLLVGGDNVGIRSESEVNGDIYRAEVVVDSRDADNPLVQLQTYKVGDASSAKTLRLSLVDGLDIYKYGTVSLTGTIAASDGKTYFANLTKVPAGYKVIGLFYPETTYDPVQADINISSISMSNDPATPNRIRIRLNNYGLTSVDFIITLTWLALKDEESSAGSEIIPLEPEQV